MAVLEGCKELQATGPEIRKIQTGKIWNRKRINEYVNGTYEENSAINCSYASNTSWGFLQEPADPQAKKISLTPSDFQKAIMSGVPQQDY